jgi:hypothetical protein
MNSQVIEKFIKRNTCKDFITQKHVEILKYNKMCRYNSGDIIKFPEYHKYLPKYILGEYGIVTERMRVVKTIGISRYYDYFVAIKMISGNNTGRERILSSNLTFTCHKIKENDFKEVKKRMIENEY